MPPLTLELLGPARLVPLRVHRGAGWEACTDKINREPRAVHVLRLTFRYLANARLPEDCVHRGVNDLEAFKI